MDVNEWNGQLRSMIGRAVLAPSSHNTQPWFFRVSGSTIDLCADRSRALPVNDPDDRELAISCGCALMNLRVAAASDGLGIRVQLLPEAEDADLLARVVVSGPSNASAEEAGLADVVERRRTYRKRFASRDLDAAVVERLTKAAKDEGAWLQPLSSEAGREKAVNLIVEGDATQWANPGWRRELATWMHTRRHRDGLTVPTLAAPVTRLVIRTFDMGGRVGAKDRELAEASPLLAVLGTEGDHVRDWLLAGQALQRTLLVGCQHGLQASYLNQPVEVASLRPQLQDWLGAGFPQILLRLGYPVDEVPPAPRRLLDDVIEHRQAEVPSVWQTAATDGTLRLGEA